MPSQQVGCKIRWFSEVHTDHEARTAGLSPNNDYPLLQLEQGGILRKFKQLGGHKNKLKYTASTYRVPAADLRIGASLNQTHQLKR